MSKVFKRSLLASALVGGIALASAVANAEQLSTLQAEEGKIHKAAAQSQAKVDGLFEQSQELLAEYRAIVDETENLKVYNDHVQRLVDDQNASIASLQRQIDGIEDTKQGVVPLMYKMIDTLDQFIDLDVPIALESRKARVAKLREVMTQSNVTTSEKYRQVLEAYMVENDYGTKIAAFEGKLAFEGKEIAVDFFHLGRVSYVAMSLDQKNAWVWNNEKRSWNALGDEYLRPITQAIRMARKQAAFDLIKLPVVAAESAQ